MKLTPPRAIALLAITLVLSACGGKQSFEVGGTISGLTSDDLVLTNNGDTVAPKSGATSFTFPNRIDYGTTYNIVANEPAHQTCSVTGGSGSAGHFTSISATVVCAQRTHALGGKVTGLAEGKTLVLTNGNTGNSVTVTGTSTSGATALDFTFPTAIADGALYNVVVFPPQPTGQTCSVTGNGVGTMATAAVTNVAVTCATN